MNKNVPHPHPPSGGTGQVLKIRFQMIANISEIFIGQLQVTQRDWGRNQNVGTRIDEDTTIQWGSNPLY